MTKRFILTFARNCTPAVIVIGDSTEIPLAGFSEIGNEPLSFINMWGTF
jgi:hypothetical protein